MNNISNTTAVDPFDPVPADTTAIIVGIAYITTGVVFITLHILCSYLMYKDKDMRNPTYQFMINLSIADIVELTAISMYAGVYTIARYQNRLFEAIVSAVVCWGWYPNCVLFVFIAFSRWISLTHGHLVDVVFKKRIIYGLHIVPWITFFLFYGTCAIIMYPVPILGYYPQFYAWGFSITHPLGLILHWNNFVFNTICAIVESGFNVLSLKWVHQTRKAILSLEDSSNRRRETKLLIQCAVIGLVFFIASTVFTIVFAANLGGDPMWTLATQCIWTFNHCVNPLIYFSVNTKLRQNLWKLLGCGGNKVGHISGSTNMRSATAGARIYSTNAEPQDS